MSGGGSQIRNNIIQNNIATESGGGIYSSCDDIIVGNNILYNKSNVWGGGISCHYSEPQIKNNSITRNTAHTGGGIYHSQSSSPIINGNYICNNSASSAGGGIFNNSLTDLTINNIICNNTAYRGGGIYWSLFTSTANNNTVCNNYAEHGAGAYIERATPHILNSIFISNQNNSEICNFYLSSETAAPYIYFSNIEDGLDSFSGNGLTSYPQENYASNIESNPLFLKPSNIVGLDTISIGTDWSLLPDSPCINAGTPDTSGVGLTSTDIIGNPRIINGRVDIGAYEYPGYIATEPDFSCNVTSGMPPLSVQFTDLSSNFPDVWEWDFDNDGTIDATEQNPSYTYMAKGIYDVKLTVHSTTYSDVIIKQDLITIYNTAPIVENPLQNFSINEDCVDSTTINLSNVFSDYDDDNLTYSISGNEHFIINIIDGYAWLTPDENWSGAETITFTANDGDGGECSDNVQITVNPVNDAPVIQLPVSFTFEEDTSSNPIDFSGYISDIDTPTENLVLSSNETNQIHVSINGHQVVFEPAQENWFGTQVITFTVSDVQSRASSQASTYISFTSVNDAPVVVNPVPDFSVTEDRDTFRYLPGIFDDVDISTGDSLSYSFSGNEYLTLYQYNDRLRIIPEANWNGSSEIIITATDTHHASAADTFIITYNPENDYPYFLDMPAVIMPIINEEYTLDLSGNVNDVDNENSSLIIIENSVNATVSGQEITFFYQDTLLENVLISVSDGEDFDAVYLMVNPRYPNTPPEVVNPVSGLVIEEDGNTTIDLYNVFNDAETPDDSLVFSYTSSNIEIEINEGEAFISPLRDWNGSENIVFIASDVLNAKAYDTVLVNVSPTPDQPALSNPLADMSFAVNTADSTINLNDVFDDADLPYGDELSFSFSGNENITISIDNGIVTLTPSQDWHGEELIIFTAEDTQGNTTSDTVLVSIFNVIEADFIASSYTGIKPLTVTFLDLSSGYPSSWQWDFDNDGEIDSYEQNPTWTYTQPGDYTVSLLASDNTCEDQEIKENFISVFSFDLISPQNNTEIDQSGYFSWQLIGNNTYQLQIGNEDFSEIVIEEDIVTLTRELMFGMQLTELSGWQNLVDDQKYYWRVKVNNEEELLSHTYSFYYNAGNDLPNPVAEGFNPPQNGNAETLTNQIISWSNATDPDFSDNPGCLQYNIQVATDSEYQSIIVDSTTDFGITYITLDNLEFDKHYYRVRTIDDEGAVSEEWSQSVRFESPRVVLGLRKGWNLISIPVLMDDMSPAGVFPNHEEIYAYENDWYTPELLEVGKGYWINNSMDENLLLIGEKVNTTVIELNQGWNLIGSVYRNVYPISSSENISSFWMCNERWESLNQLGSGFGYWVKAGENTSITLSPENEPVLRNEVINQDIDNIGIPELPKKQVKKP